MDRNVPLKTFEQPLNERIRACLRLDHLFSRIDHHLQSPSRDDTLCTVLLLLEAADVLSRIDIKRELIKELERQQARLMKVPDTPGVDREKLNALLEKQEGLIKALHAYHAQPGAHLKNHELLNAVRQRASIPGALCEFDIAGLHYWLGLSPEERREDIDVWLEPFTDIRHANEMVIDLIRNSVDTMSVTAEDGFLQQSIESATPYQLLRVLVDEDTVCYPEISAGKHRFTVRFMTLDRENGHPRQVHEDIEFRLALCRL
ncbi:MAG: cell division protein ZapD [Halothiobacillaceae bacterium]|mgnify:CR=1 FL=1|nr:cell division protein ZapD [Halothiobacillaceae bacterium]